LPSPLLCSFISLATFRAFHQRNFAAKLEMSEKTSQFRRDDVR
jgi:hypothetical protein